MAVAGRHQRLWAGAVLVTFCAGVVAGWLLPRGPVTTAEAVTTVLIAFLVGGAVGRLTGSRWALLMAPCALVVGYELARMPVSGPTVEEIRLDGVYGILAFVVGRGVDGLLLVLPLLVGVLAGLALRRRGAPGVDRRRRALMERVLLAGGTLVLVVLVAGLLRPADTEPIEGPDPVAELVTVHVGGYDQHLMVRGADASAPVLLFLEGGPGGSALGRMRHSAEPLERDFVVVTWDQRGTGKSYPALDPTGTLTVDQLVEDCLEVTQYLRERFDQDRIYLVGSSWGTILGVRAVQESPNAFHAYVGTGQMVDPFETDTLMYAENLDQAERTGDTARVARLRAMGPPPYADTLDYPDALAGNPELMAFPHGQDYDPASEYPLAFLVGEYTLIEQLRGMAAVAETFAVLYPQLSDVDLREQAHVLDVPVYIVAGRYEAPGRAVLAEEWFAALTAPYKEWVTLDHSGHTPPYDEPARFAEVMTEVVLAGTNRR